MAFHISPESGEPRPCKAQSPESCPVGGDHFSDKNEAQSFAEEKLSQEHGSLSSHSKKSKKVDFTQIESMEKLEDGSYPIKAGTYYVVSSEGWNEIDDDDEQAEAVEELLLVDDLDIEDKRQDTAVGIKVDGEPFYSITEGWSGVTNSIVTPKTYKAMMKKLKISESLKDEEPSTIVFSKDTTVGRAGLMDDDDYGMLYIGGKPHDFFEAEDSIIMPGETVID